MSRSLVDRRSRIILSAAAMVMIPVFCAAAGIAVWVATMEPILAELAGNVLQIMDGSEKTRG